MKNSPRPTPDNRSVSSQAGGTMRFATFCLKGEEREREKNKSRLETLAGLTK